MNRLRYHELVEADRDIQNPMSPDKLRRVIDYLDIADGERIVDVGSGKGWLMAELVRTRPVRIVGLEQSRVFADAAEKRLATMPLVGSAEIVLGLAQDYPLPARPFDIGLCIGATMALGDLEGTLDWMARAVRPGGRIAVGEPFALRPMPMSVSERWPEYARTLADVGAALEARRFDLTGLVASSEDDWDHYESQHWRVAANFLAAHPDDPDAAEIEAKTGADRARYLAEERACFGWAVFVARKHAVRKRA